MYLQFYDIRVYISIYVPKIRLEKEAPIYRAQDIIFEDPHYNTSPNLPHLLNSHSVPATVCNFTFKVPTKTYCSLANVTALF